MKAKMNMTFSTGSNGKNPVSFFEGHSMYHSPIQFARSATETTESFIGVKMIGQKLSIISRPQLEEHCLRLSANERTFTVMQQVAEW